MKHVEEKLLNFHLFLILLSHYNVVEEDKEEVFPTPETLQNI